MLQSIIGKLSSERIILASSSPRRAEVLKNIKFPFEVIPSDYDESKIDKTQFAQPHEYVIETAECKVMEVAERLKSDDKVPELLIGADTAVTMDNIIYGKPRDENDAFKMLSKLSNKNHKVYTGVVLVNYSQQGNPEVIRKFFEATTVSVANLTPDVIKEYIRTGEPMDKAGGYGIQGIGGTLIKSINGDYFNVMGFPLHRFCVELLKISDSNGL